jgi:hypothetical protein
MLLATLAGADERTIHPAGPGPNRLDPDVELLAHAQPDLRDLRLAGDGREIPYLLIEPSSDEPNWITGRVLPVAATKTTSGFEADLGTRRSVDRMRIDGIATPFLKRARLEGSGDRSHWTLLASDATLFDLPDEKLRNIEIAFDAGDYRYLRVTWDDRNSAVVRGVGKVAARLHEVNAAPGATLVPLPFRRIASEPQRSRYRITLPGPSLPIIAIEALVANGEVFRDASVYAQRLEQGQIAPVLLGSARLKRAERFGGVAADLAVPVSKPDEVDLELVVDDGNNPPLALTGIYARLAPLPWIWFEAPSTAPLTARYGDARLTAPRYDVEASRKAVARTAPPAARWQNDARPSKKDEAESATLASFRGATVNRNDFRSARPVSAGPAGVTRLVLDAEVLAHSRRAEDVRLVDAADRQVPYIVETVAAPLTIPLKIPSRVAEGTSSRYVIELPYATLPTGTKLVLTTSAKVFERAVSLHTPAGERRGGEGYTLGSETWRSSQPDLAPPPFSFDLVSSDAKRVELLVNEGDNAPLPIATATLQMPAVALRFYNPGTPITLLYGNGQVSAPQYDLALLAPRVLSEPAQELTLAPGAASAASEESVNSRDVKIFWIALVVAAVALVAVLVRLIGSRASAAKS